MQKNEKNFQKIITETKEFIKEMNEKIILYKKIIENEEINKITKTKGNYGNNYRFR